MVTKLDKKMQTIKTIEKAFLAFLLAYYPRTMVSQLGYCLNILVMKNNSLKQKQRYVLCGLIRMVV